MDGILAYIGIGSNLGDSLQCCKEAIKRISAIEGVKLERTSSFYKTEPVIDNPENVHHLEKQNWFVNAVIEIRSILVADDLLMELKEIEKIMGRTREYAGAPRTIDLDLLLFGQEIMENNDLTVPHPLMHKRRFVLEPMCEIASYVIHPAFGVSMRGLYERLSDPKAVERLT